MDAACICVASTHSKNAAASLSVGISDVKQDGQVDPDQQIASRCQTIGKDGFMPIKHAFDLKQW
jgi:hypothetical protein